MLVFCDLTSYIHHVSVSITFLTLFCSIHKGFCFRQGISSPISDLTERLLLEERDPPATPQESLYEAPPFDEVRIIDCTGCWARISVFLIILMGIDMYLFCFPHLLVLSC